MRDAFDATPLAVFAERDELVELEGWSNLEVRYAND
jgi:hypothetical protein